MHGIRTYFRRWSDEESGFQQSYQCLFPLFRGLYFVDSINDPCFRFPWDGDDIYQAFCEASLDRDGNDGIFDATVLVANARHVSDDWNGIVLVDVSQLNANRTLRDHVCSSNVTADESRLHRILFFHNFDGAFWQFFTNDQRCIELMLTANRNNPDLDLRTVKYTTDYPDPGEYRENYPPKA